MHDLNLEIEEDNYKELLEMHDLVLTTDDMRKKIPPAMWR